MEWCGVALSWMRLSKLMAVMRAGIGDGDGDGGVRWNAGCLHCIALFDEGVVID